MPDTAITAKIHQAFYVHRSFAPEVTLDSEIGDSRSQIGNFGLRQILYCHFRLNAGRSADLPGSRGADAKDRRQPNHDVLVQRNVYACYSSHFTPFLVFLALALLMTFVSTNHPDNALTPNYLAVSAHFSNRSSDFHEPSPKIADESAALRVNVITQVKFNFSTVWSHCVRSCADWPFASCPRTDGSLHAPAIAT